MKLLKIVVVTLCCWIMQSYVSICAQDIGKRKCAHRIYDAMKGTIEANDHQKETPEDIISCEPCKQFGSADKQFKRAMKIAKEKKDIDTAIACDRAAEKAKTTIIQRHPYATSSITSILVAVISGGLGYYIGLPKDGF